jgi:hypothetical protein
MWADLAISLARLRAQMLTRAKKSRNEKRLIHVSRAEGVSIAALTICKTLRSHSTRFDRRRFMRLVNSLVDE